MTELTPAERERIFQEEKARHEAREQLDQAARRERVAAHKGRQRRTVLGVLIAGALLAVFLAVVGEDTSPPSVNVGEEGRIASGAKTVLAATDDATFDQIVKSQEARDQAGLTVLILSGKAFFIDEGTRVLVIDRSTLRRKVRTLEGPAVGRAGWIPAEWVRQ